MIAGLYALVVGGVGAMLREQGAAWLPWLAAGVIAVSFAPLRDALQRAANRLTFGQWAQPGEVLARTSRRLADAGDVQALLGSLATELAEDLRLEHVQIVGSDGRVLATAGPSVAELDELTLTAYGAPVGALRWAKQPLRERDRELLAGVATQLGSVVHAHDLLDRVRTAQERLVLAHEEERRRLRRDLHDGLGPALAALTMQVDTLRNTVDDEAARAHLLTLRGHIQDAVGDVRRSSKDSSRRSGRPRVGRVAAPALRTVPPRRHLRGRPGDRRTGRVAGGGGGRRLPDRPGVAQQCSQALGSPARPRRRPPRRRVSRGLRGRRRQR